MPVICASWLEMRWSCGQWEIATQDLTTWSRLILPSHYGFFLKQVTTSLKYPLKPQAILQSIHLDRFVASQATGKLLLLPLPSNFSSKSEALFHWHSKNHKIRSNPTWRGQSAGHQLSLPVLHHHPGRNPLGADTIYCPKQLQARGFHTLPLIKGKGSTEMLTASHL